ncbi:MAG: hypothetical protein J6C64_06200 [Lachnospiraceae bacterium]|nr:hypothetical protein [Lachnospiraceae bacterium]
MEIIKKRDSHYKMRAGEFGEWLDELGINGACRKMEELGAFGTGDYTKEKYENEETFSFAEIEKELGLC